MRSENTGVTWSQQVRDELLERFTKSSKCRQAELMAIMLLNRQTVRFDPETGLYIYEESSGSGRGRKDENILPETGKNCSTGRRKTYNIKNVIDLSKDPKELYKDPESKRAFLRGAFIASGSFTNPNKSYQFELIAGERWQAEELQGLLKDFGVTARIMERRSRYVVYVKDGEAIADALNVIGAHKTLLEYENIRILREMRGSVNRQVNCETANIGKTVAASLKQRNDIELIRDTIGFDQLEDPLKSVCLARLAHPDVALSELGNLMVPPLSKSGVNHRFRKISQMAQEIRARNNRG